MDDESDNNIVPHQSVAKKKWMLVAGDHERALFWSPIAKQISSAGYMLKTITNSSDATLSMMINRVSPYLMENTAVVVMHVLYQDLVRRAKDVTLHQNLGLLKAQREPNLHQLAQQITEADQDWKKLNPLLKVIWTVTLPIDFLKFNSDFVEKNNQDPLSEREIRACQEYSDIFQCHLQQLERIFSRQYPKIEMLKLDDLLTEDAMNVKVQKCGSLFTIQTDGSQFTGPYVPNVHSGLCKNALWKHLIDQKIIPRPANEGKLSCKSEIKKKFPISCKTEMEGEVEVLSSENVDNMDATESFEANQSVSKYSNDPLLHETTIPIYKDTTDTSEGFEKAAGENYVIGSSGKDHNASAMHSTSITCTEGSQSALGHSVSIMVEAQGESAVVEEITSVTHHSSDNICEETIILVRQQSSNFDTVEPANPFDLLQSSSVNSEDKSVAVNIYKSFDIDADEYTPAVDLQKSSDVHSLQSTTAVDLQSAVFDAKECITADVHHWSSIRNSVESASAVDHHFSGVDAKQSTVLPDHQSSDVDSEESVAVEVHQPSNDVVDLHCSSEVDEIKSTHAVDLHQSSEIGAEESTPAVNLHQLSEVGSEESTAAVDLHQSFEIGVKESTVSVDLHQSSEIGVEASAVAEDLHKSSEIAAEESTFEVKHHQSAEVDVRDSRTEVRDADVSGKDDMCATDLNKLASKSKESTVFLNEAQTTASYALTETVTTNLDQGSTDNFMKDEEELPKKELIETTCDETQDFAEDCVQMDVEDEFIDDDNVFADELIYDDLSDASEEQEMPALARKAENMKEKDVGVSPLENNPANCLLAKYYTEVPSCQEFLLKKELPFIGLQFIAELKITKANSSSTAPIYFCILCNKQIASQTVLVSHVNSVPHKLKCAKLHLPVVHQRFGAIPLPEWTPTTVREFREELQEAASHLLNYRISAINKEELDEASYIIIKNLDKLDAFPRFTLDTITKPLVASPVENKFSPAYDSASPWKDSVQLYGPAKIRAGSENRPQPPSPLDAVTNWTPAPIDSSSHVAESGWVGAPFAPSQSQTEIQQGREAVWMRLDKANPLKLGANNNKKPQQVKVPVIPIDLTLNWDLANNNDTSMKGMLSRINTCVSRIVALQRIILQKQVLLARDVAPSHPDYYNMWCEFNAKHWSTINSKRNFNVPKNWRREWYSHLEKLLNLELDEERQKILNVFNFYNVIQFDQTCKEYGVMFKVLIIEFKHQKFFARGMFPPFLALPSGPPHGPPFGGQAHGTPFGGQAHGPPFGTRPDDPPLPFGGPSGGPPFNGPSHVRPFGDPPHFDPTRASPQFHPTHAPQDFGMTHVPPKFEPTHAPPHRDWADASPHGETNRVPPLGDPTDAPPLRDSNDAPPLGDPTDAIPHGIPNHDPPHSKPIHAPLHSEPTRVAHHGEPTHASLHPLMDNLVQPSSEELHSLRLATEEVSKKRNEETPQREEVSVPFGSEERFSSRCEQSASPSLICSNENEQESSAGLKLNTILTKLEGLKEILPFSKYCIADLLTNANGCVNLEQNPLDIFHLNRKNIHALHQIYTDLCEVIENGQTHPDMFHCLEGALWIMDEISKREFCGVDLFKIAEDTEGLPKSDIFEALNNALTEAKLGVSKRITLRTQLMEIIRKIHAKAIEDKVKKVIGNLKVPLVEKQSCAPVQSPEDVPSGLTKAGSGSADPKALLTSDSPDSSCSWQRGAEKDGTGNDRISDGPSVNQQTRSNDFRAKASELGVKKSQQPNAEPKGRRNALSSERSSQPLENKRFSQQSPSSGNGFKRSDVGNLSILGSSDRKRGRDESSSDFINPMESHKKSRRHNQDRADTRTQNSVTNWEEPEQSIHERSGGTPPGLKDVTITYDSQNVAGHGSAYTSPVERPGSTLPTSVCPSYGKAGLSEPRGSPIVFSRSGPPRLIDDSSRTRDFAVPAASPSTSGTRPPSSSTWIPPAKTRALTENSAFGGRLGVAASNWSSSAQPSSSQNTKSGSSAAAPKSVPPSASTSNVNINSMIGNISGSIDVTSNLSLHSKGSLNRTSSSIQLKGKQSFTSDSRLSADGVSSQPKSTEELNDLLAAHFQDLD